VQARYWLSQPNAIPFIRVVTDVKLLNYRNFRVVTDVKLLNYRNFVVPETSGKAEELVDQGR
jgi:hypothetical protein